MPFSQEDCAARWYFTTSPQFSQNVSPFCVIRRGCSQHGLEAADSWMAVACWTVSVLFHPSIMMALHCLPTNSVCTMVAAMLVFFSTSMATSASFGIMTSSPVDCRITLNPASINASMARLTVLDVIGLLDDFF